LESPGAFETLAEFAISLAGFAGVVVVFRRSEGRLHPADGIRVFMALMPTLACAFLALLPIALELVDLPPATVWLVASIVHGTAVVSIVSAILIRVGQLTPDARSVLSRPLSAFFYTLLGLSILVNLLSATAVVGVPPVGTYFFGLLALLAVGATVFLRMVFIRPAA